jgi:hypothetical protein
LKGARSVRTRRRKSEAPQDQAQALTFIIEATGYLIEDLQTRSEPVWKMQKWLVRQLGAERLEAIGIMMRPEMAREPQQVPSFIFRGHPKINWGKCTVENFEQQFVGVEVRRPVVEKLPHSAAAGSAHGKPGRRRVDGPLRIIVCDVRAEGRFNERSQKERIAIVRDQARKRHPNLFPKGTQPSDTKIIEALRAEGCAH